jgi:hypothetical protein
MLRGKGINTINTKQFFAEEAKHNKQKRRKERKKKGSHGQPTIVGPVWVTKSTEQCSLHLNVPGPILAYTKSKKNEQKPSCHSSCPRHQPPQQPKAPRLVPFPR